MEREKFSSRFGFIMISAGCAIGLGNVWRFPYITGMYGGAAFVLLYLIFLVIFTLPILIMEFAVGRGAQKGIARSFDELEPKGTKWHIYKWIGLGGNYLLMMFYTVVAGWFLAYIVKCASGQFTGLDIDGVGALFSNMLADPVELLIFTLIVVAIGFVVTLGGLKKGVERITKWMMVALFVIMAALAINSLLMPGAAEGLSFYLAPDFSKLFAGGISGFADAAFAAMGQAFFTASVGIGAMSIFGSYIDKERSLAGEGIRIVALDTLVALMAGLIIFPACFTYGVSADSGPGLVFVTLPAIFSQMPLGNVWGTLFFLFMSFAALSTIIAVFENVISFSMDEWGMSRTKACCINCALLLVLSIPCILGFNLWSGFTINGMGDIQGIEDFLVSNTILPLGSLVFLLFCTLKCGWGWDNFIAEADAGSGIKYPKIMKNYLKYVVPIFIVAIVIMGYIQLF